MRPKFDENTESEAVPTLIRPWSRSKSRQLPCADVAASLGVLAPLRIDQSFASGSLVEIAHNETIYCGVAKIHRVNSDLARTAVDNHHMTRNGFKDLFKAIFGKPLDKPVAEKIEKAELVRDRILHGKTVSELEKRKAVIDILDYAEALNSAVCDLAGFRPFGLLTGFKGRAQSLDKSTSRWVLKGIGLTMS